jgi:hypothetical protein
VRVRAREHSDILYNNFKSYNSIKHEIIHWNKQRDFTTIHFLIHSFTGTDHFTKKKIDIL